MNAKQELINLLQQVNAKMICAKIESTGGKHILKLNHTDQQRRLFVNSLNFEYDNGYGYQHIRGTVWFVDGTWAERGEYDGSEWWEHRKCPEVPDGLKAQT